MKRKNLFFVMIALFLSTIIGFAQTTTQNLKIKEPGKTEFVPYWYMQLHGGASYTLGEASFGKLISPAAALNFGYQFNPACGLRVGVSGWEAKGAWVGPAEVYKFNYLQGNVDVMFDLFDLGHFNPNRFFNAYLFLGVGVNDRFNNDEAVAVNNSGKKLTYLWTGNKIGIAGRGGLGIKLRISDYVAFNVEANTNIMTDKYNSKKAENPDWQFNLLGGITIKFGKGYKKTAPVYYEPEPVVAEPVKEKPKKPVVVPKEVPTEVYVEPLIENIFFKINSAKIQHKESEKVNALVKFMKDNPKTKVAICGYADKETGNAAFNMSLSVKRANSVAKALKDMGISADRITTDAKGDTVQPFDTKEKNRVSICITK